MVVLTRNEAANIAGCLRALTAEEDPSLRVLVVDADSRDATVAIAAGFVANDARVRVLTLPTAAPVGEARNAALEHIPSDHVVAFLSADTAPAPGWLAAARSALLRADIVYGAQDHEPETLTLAAVVRGLRYHHFDRANLPPEAYASHVNAVMSPAALSGWRFGTTPAQSALDDVVLAHTAKARGLRIAYEPALRVRHKDATTWRQEWRKIRREATGWGRLWARVGYRWDVLAWGVAVVAAIATLLLTFHAAAFAALVGVVYAPAARRPTARAWQRYGARRVLAATLVAPAFDLAFLVSYVMGAVTPE